MRFSVLPPSEVLPQMASSLPHLLFHQRQIDRNHDRGYGPIAEKVLCRAAVGVVHLIGNRRYRGVVKIRATGGIELRAFLNRRGGDLIGAYEAFDVIEERIVAQRGIDAKPMVAAFQTLRVCGVTRD